MRTRYKAKNGTWTLYNELNPLEVMFVDDSFTKVINTKGAVLKHCSNITYEGDEGKMNLNDGFQSLTYSGANLKVYKGYDKFKKLFMLSALGDEKATQDAKVNCSSFNYARSNDKVHMVLDVEPSKPEYEPHFREESRYVLDKTGNHIKDDEHNDIKFEPPKEIKDKHKIDWEKRKSDFESRCRHGKTNRT